RQCRILRDLGRRRAKMQRSGRGRPEHPWWFVAMPRLRAEHGVVEHGSVE
ncbi:hypothetical protein COCCADRAFT_80854, partial [Bipolaris zeicola 26-R-13]